MTTGATILLVLTALFAALMTGILLSLAGEVVHGDAAFGQGVAWLYVITLTVFTWLSMGGLLWKTADSGLLPASHTAVAAILWFGSGVAAAIALNIMMDGSNRWAAVIPVSIPWLAVVYMISLTVGSVRPIAAGMPASIGIAGLIAALSCLSFVGLMYKLDAPNREAAAHQAEMEDPVKQAQRREQSTAKLQTMTDETPLEEWMPLLRPENGVRAEALARLRTSPRRQDDIERVALDSTRYLELIPELDVQLTFPLCDAMGKQIWNTGFALMLNGERGKPLTSEVGEPELTLLPWYREHGCDCKSSLAYMAQKLQESYKDSPERKALLDRLAQLMR
jgi:hypothetical protein